MLRTFRRCSTSSVVLSLPFSQPALLTHPFDDVDSPGYKLATANTDFAELICTEDDAAWLHKRCPFLQLEYLDYLTQFRFKPDQVKVEFVASKENANKGKLEISATGPWVETILWEVPLMACLSELYFITTDKDWTYEGQRGVCLMTSLFANSPTESCGSKKRRTRRRVSCLKQTPNSASSGLGEGGLSTPRISSLKHSFRRRKHAKGESLSAQVTWVNLLARPASPDSVIGVPRPEIRFATYWDYCTVCLASVSTSHVSLNILRSEWFMGVCTTSSRSITSS